MRSTTAYSCTCGARARSIRGRRRRCAAEDVDVSTLRTGFVSSGEHLPVSQDSHNVCRSLTVLARRCGHRRHLGAMDPGHPVSRPGGGVPADGDCGGFADLHRWLVTRRQCHCRAARRRHDTVGGMPKSGTVTGDIEGPGVSTTLPDDIDDRRRTEEAGRAGGRRVIAGAGSVRPCLSSRPLNL
jgi:hypothetical protein